MINHIQKFGMILIVILLIGACSAPFSEEINEVKEEVETVFKSQPEKPNNSSKDIDYYLPFGLEVKEESQNNVLLKNGARTYILFYNQHEKKDSKIVYESTLKQQEWDGNETFENGGEFGYMLVKKLDDDRYHLVVGTGGVKLTTKTDSIKKDAATMMKIAKSVNMK